MKTVIFLVPPDVQFGFSLAGVREQVCRLNLVPVVSAAVSSQIVGSPVELVRTVRELMDEEQVGVIVVDERLLSHDSTETVRALEKNWGGIVVVLPSPVIEEEPPEDYTTQLIKKAIGYHVRLNG